MASPPFPLNLSDAFSLLTPYATSLWYKTGVTELREDWPFVHLHFSWMIFNLFLDEEGFFFFCLLGKISVLKLKKIFLSCLWMFKLTFQWFLTFLPVPDFSRLLFRCEWSSVFNENEIFLLVRVRQTIYCKLIFFVWFGVFFCLHQSADPRWLFCNIWYTNTCLFLSHLLVMFTCACWGGTCLSQGLDGAKNNAVKLFRD